MRTIPLIACLLGFTGTGRSVAAPAATAPADQTTEARFLEVSVANTSQTVRREAGVDYVIHFVNADTSGAPFATLFLSKPIAPYLIQQFADLGILELLPKAGLRANGFLIVAPQTKQKPLVLQVAINRPAPRQSGLPR
jgi:hypothetical protein